MIDPTWLWFSLASWIWLVDPVWSAPSLLVIPHLGVSIPHVFFFRMGDLISEKLHDLINKEGNFHIMEAPFNILAFAVS